MPWGPSPLLAIYLPEDASPDEAQFVIDSAVPAELSTYYSTNYGADIVFAMLWYFGGTPNDYYYMCSPQLGVAVPYFGYGWVRGGIVYEMGVQNSNLGVNRFTRIGSHAFAGYDQDPISINVNRGGTGAVAKMASLFRLGTDVDLTLDDRSHSRGLLTSVSSTSNSSAIGTTETAVLTLSNVVFRARRAYAVRYGSQIICSLTTNVGIFRARKTNATGTLWGGSPAYGPSGAPPNIAAQGEFVIKRAADSDLTATIVLTLQASSSGTATHVGANPSARYMRIVDIGDDASYPEGFAIT